MRGRGRKNQGGREGDRQTNQPSAAVSKRLSVSHGCRDLGNPISAEKDSV